MQYHKGLALIITKSNKNPVFFNIIFECVWMNEIILEWNENKHLFTTFKRKS